MGFLNMAYFCRILFLLSCLYFISNAKSTGKVDAENEPEKNILINLLERILQIKEQQKNEKKLDDDVSPLTSHDRKLQMMDKSLENDASYNKKKDGKKEENESTLKKFDNCENLSPEEERVVNSFNIEEENGKSHGTRCKKPRNAIHDSLIITPEQKGSMKRNFEKIEFPLWPKGLVPYVISDKFTEEEKKVMRTAFDEIESKTCIKLEPYNGKPVDPDNVAYVNIINGDGCYSYMGRISDKMYQPQNLSLGRQDGCIQNMVVIHEVLHAIGMVHEQSRRDRDKYLTINYESIPGGQDDINFKKFLTDDLNPFDYESVLQYGLWDGSTDGRKVMVPKIKALSFLPGSATGLEFYDVKDVTDAYKCTEHCTSKPACKYSGFVNFKCECYCPSGTKGDDCSKLETHKDCGGFVSVADGPKTIVSPNYPQNYPVNMQCVWMVETKKGSHVRLIVDDLHLSSSDENCHHWLEVRFNLLAQTGRRICGNGLNADMYETTPDGYPNVMMLLFNSKKVDEAKPTKGFKLTVSSFDAANPCKPNPCVNGGKCTVSGSHFKCSCINGWTGKTCEVNPCNPNPCKNGGKCTGHGSQFECSCNGGWKGETCEVKVDPCETNPCNNGGKCSPSGPTFICSCSAEWVGIVCDVKSPCHSYQCLNGGKCKATTHSVKCICPSGWLGKRCDLKDRCDFNSKNEKCFMFDNWMEGDPENDRFKQDLQSDIRNNGIKIVKSTITESASGSLYSKPSFNPGLYCFSFSYYQYKGHGEGDYASVYVSDGQTDILDVEGNKETKWINKRASITLNTASTIHMDAQVFGNAFVAFDDISIVKGSC